MKRLIYISSLFTIHTHTHIMYTTGTISSTVSKNIRMNDISIWISIFPHHPSCIFIHSEKTLDIPIDIIISNIWMHLPENIITCPANTHGTVQKICQHMHSSKYIHKCGMLLFTKKISIPFGRQYDIYEEIYLGTLPIHTMPFHHIVYIVLVIDTDMYYIAIEPSIKHVYKAQIFIDISHEALMRMLFSRYTPNNISIEWHV